MMVAANDGNHLIRTNSSDEIGLNRSATVPKSDFLLQYSSNRSIDDPWYSIFIAIYSVLFVVALTLNIIMAFSAIRKIKGKGTHSSEPFMFNRANNKQLWLWNVENIKASIKKSG